MSRKTETMKLQGSIKGLKLQYRNLRNYDMRMMLNYFLYLNLTLYIYNTNKNRNPNAYSH
jgi:hypothetical protein